MPNLMTNTYTRALKHAKGAWGSITGYGNTHRQMYNFARSQGVGAMDAGSTIGRRMAGDANRAMIGSGGYVAAGAGAGIGGVYGAASDDTSIMGGAAKGATIGLAGLGALKATNAGARGGLSRSGMMGPPKPGDMI